MGELPHLKLYLRRMLATPQGLPWREALRTPRVRSLLLVLGCVVATTFHQALTLAAQGAPWSPRWLQVPDRLPEQIYTLSALCGVWAVLFVAADQMSTLALQARRAPDWHSTPLPSSSAVLSTLLASLLACLPALFGLALFIALAGGSMWSDPWNDSTIPAPEAIGGCK